MKFFQNQLWVEGWCMFNESHSVNWRTREYNHAAPLESTLVMHWDMVGKLSLNLMPWSNSDVYSLTESCVQESESAQPSFPGSGVSHKMSVWAVVHWRPWPSPGGCLLSDSAIGCWQKVPVPCHMVVSRGLSKDSIVVAGFSQRERSKRESSMGTICLCDLGDHALSLLQCPLGHTDELYLGWKGTPVSTKCQEQCDPGGFPGEWPLFLQSLTFLLPGRQNTHFAQDTCLISVESRSLEGSGAG